MRTALVRRWLVVPAVAAALVLVTGVALVSLGVVQRGVTYGLDGLDDLRLADAPGIGANTFLHQEPDPGKVVRELEVLRGAGIGIIRQEFQWIEIEPLAKGSFVDAAGRSTWDKYDRIVDAAGTLGIEILARLDRPPAWATPGFDPTANPVHSDAAVGPRRLRRFRRRGGRTLCRTGALLPDLERTQSDRRVGRASAGPRRLPRDAPTRGRAHSPGQPRGGRRAGGPCAHHRDRSRESERSAVSPPAVRARRARRFRCRLQHVLRVVHRPPRLSCRPPAHQLSARRALARGHGGVRRHPNADLGLRVRVDGPAGTTGTASPVSGATTPSTIRPRGPSTASTGRARNGPGCQRS